MKGKTALFLAFVSLLFGCPPGGESGTVTLGDVSVTPVRGYNTTATFELKATVQTNVEATLTIVVKDETGAEAANSGAMKVKAGNSTQTFSTKIEKFGNMKATFTLAAAGVETQTKSVDFEVLEGGVPSAEFGWPATGVYAGARITISMADVKADTAAGTGEGTFEFSQAAFTMTKEDGTPVEGVALPTLDNDSDLNKDFQIILPSEHGNYSITLSVTNTNNQTREKTVEFALADKVNVASIEADPSSFSDLIVNDTVKVTLTFTGEGEQTPSDINVNWDEGSNYSVELVEQTAITAVYNLTVLSSSLSSGSATATAADGSGKSVTITFSGIVGNKVPDTKTVNGREVELKFIENFNKIDDAFFEKWRADGWRSDSDKLKRFYWRPEALEMTEFEGRQVFTMFTREWGSRETDPETYPGRDQSNDKNNAGEPWIAGGIHLQDNIVFGYIEARVRTDRDDPNHWDAFWSYDTDTESPLEYEFDIMEAKSVRNLDVTTHFWAKPAKTPGYTKWTQPTKEHGDVDLNNDWYTLGLYWTPEEVIYYGYHGDEPRATAGIKSDYTLTHGYSGSRAPQLEIPFITRWKQGFKFTTELGYGMQYGGGRPATKTEDKYYIDYFAYYHIPVSQAVLAENIQNGTAAFDRTKPGDDRSAWADIASADNPIYVTVTPDANYTTESVKATWGNESVDLTQVEGEPNRWMLTVTADMPQYFDFKTQKYGDPVTITPTFVQSNAALESVELNPEALSGIGGTTVTVNYTPKPSNAVINNVTVSAGYEYDKETKLLTLKNNDGESPEPDNVIFTFTTVADAEPVTATLPVTIYPNTYVQRNGVFYKPVKTVDDFSDDSTEVTIKANSNGNGNNLAAWNRNANAAEITVNNLPTENGADQLTIDNIDSTTADKNNWLVELTLNYSNVDDVRAIIAFTSNSDRNWWLLRNTFSTGRPGGGTAFRVAANSGDENSKYTLTAGADATLGYLFDSNDITRTDGSSTAHFFFNGETKTVLLNSSANTISTAPSLSDSFVLTFAKESDDVTDPGTITLKKIVFYKPVEDAAQ